MAASATAHCTRLPALVSLLDGDEDEEHQFRELANFLALCESGFFMCLDPIYIYISLEWGTVSVHCLFCFPLSWFLCKTGILLSLDTTSENVSKLDGT